MATSSYSEGLPPRRLTRDFLLSRLDFLVTVQLWPAGRELRPRDWLSNFSEEEMDHAIHLLNSFLYFPRIMVDRMLCSAFQSLSLLLCSNVERYPDKIQMWDDIKADLHVTYPTGERPNPTDSGHIFARKARQVLGIPEERVLHPRDAVEILLARDRARILFVDDFLGTGTQFVETWEREYDVPGGPASFRSLCDWYGRAIYMPVLATAAGVSGIRSQAPTVALGPAHILGDRYSAFSDHSYMWPHHLKTSAEDFIRDASERAGVPDFGGLYPGDWRGFGKLGLAVAVEGSVPDATLPIFYWQEGDWKPLIQRR